MATQYPLRGIVINETGTRQETLRMVVLHETTSTTPPPTTQVRVITQA